VKRSFENDRMRRLVCLAVGVGLGVTLIFAGGASARAARWQPARHLESSAGQVPVLAVDPRGDALAAWSHADGRFGELSVAQRLGGHAFGNVAHLYRSHTFLSAPSVALAASGAAAVAWLDGDALRVRVRTSLRRRFGPVRTLARGSTLAKQLVGIDSHGRAVVAWSSGRAGDRRINTRTGNVSGHFGSVMTVSGGGDALLSSLAVNQRGDAAIGWAYQPTCAAPAATPSGGMEAVRLRPAGAASFGAPSTWPGVGPTVGVADNGHVTVISDNAPISCSTDGTPFYEPGRGEALVREGSESTGIADSPLDTGLMDEASAIAHNGTLAIVGLDFGAGPDDDGQYRLLTRAPGASPVVRELRGGDEPGPISVNPLAAAVLSARTADFHVLGLVTTPTVPGSFVPLTSGDRELERAATGIDDAGRATIVMSDDDGNILDATYG
jgi:hypothetical protein